MKSKIELNITFDAVAAKKAIAELVDLRGDSPMSAQEIAKVIQVGIAAGCKIEAAPNKHIGSELDVDRMAATGEVERPVHVEDAVAEHAHLGQQIPDTNDSWDKGLLGQDERFVAVATEEDAPGFHKHGTHAHRADDGERMPFSRRVNDALRAMCPPDIIEIEGRAWRDTTVDFVLQGNDYAAFVECWRVFGRGWKFDDNSASAVLAARAWKARDEIADEQIRTAEQCARMEEREKKAGTLRDYYEMTHALIPLHQCYVLLPEWQKFETVPSAPGRVIDMDRNLRENIHRLRGTGSQKDAERRALRSLFVDWLRMVDDMERQSAVIDAAKGES